MINTVGILTNLESILFDQNPLWLLEFNFLLFCYLNFKITAEY